jgi:hypothetical protein
MSSNSFQAKSIRARRDLVMERQDLRHPSSPRQSPASPTSMPVKRQRDPEVERLLEEFERRKQHA